MNVALKDSGGSVLQSKNCVTSNNVFLEPVSLAGGTYSVVIDPQSAYTLTGTLTVYDVPPDATGTITAGGPSVSVTLSVPGQNAILTLSATSGQRVTVSFTNNSLSTWPNCGIALSLKDSTGAVLQSNNCVTGGNVTFPAITLSGGTYSIVVDPVAAYTLGITVTVTNSP